MWYEYKPYVNVAERRRRAAAAMRRRRKKGLSVDPVTLTGKGIATSFWGRAWCTHLEKLGDFANRLPRGRTYVRNGSVCHLAITPGRVQAIVMGTELYEVELTVTRLPATRWRQLKKRCAGGVGSVLELLEGRLSDAVMRVITDPAEGMFPTAKQIRVDCSCPDWASVCKHVAAAFYGVGARLDERPELLFALRGVDHQELIDEGAGALTRVTAKGGARRLSGERLGDVFGIDLVDGDGAPDAPSTAAGHKTPARTRNSKGAASGKPAAASARKTTGKVTAKKASAPVTVARRRRSRTKSAPSPRTVPAGARTGSGHGGKAVTGASIKRLRRRLGLTRAELARLLGVSAASVARWESVRGALGIHARSAVALERAEGMTAEGAKRALRRR